MGDFTVGIVVGFIFGVGLLTILILLGTMLNAIKLEWNKEWWNS